MKYRRSLGLFFVFATVAFQAGCTDIDATSSESDPDPTASDEADSAEQSDAPSAQVAAVAEAVRRHDEARRAMAADAAVEPAVSRFSQRRAQHGLSLDHSFAVRSVLTDESGDKHARLDHFYKGVRVLSSTAAVHTGADGHTREEDVGSLRGAIAIETKPALSLDEVRAIAGARPERTGRPLVEPRVELAILPVEERFVIATGAQVTGEERDLNALDVERRVVAHRLVYQVDTLDEARGAPPASYRYLIDAASGEVVKVRSLSHSDQGMGKSFKNPGPLGANIVALDTLKHVNGAQNAFEPFDSFRNFGVWDDDSCHTCGANVDIGDNTWGDSKAFMGDASATLVNRQTAVVDGLFGMQATWDMLKNVFGLFGYDNAFYNGHAYVHVDTDWDDASYSSFTGNISVGDSGPSNRSNRTGIDTMGHEYGHGLNDFMAGLGGNDEGEGLNEASSDIIGEISEAYSGAGLFNSMSSIPTSPGPDWVNRGSGRSFANPNGPRYWSTGLAGISDEHIRAMPMDHGFYFLSQGSINDPISSKFSMNVPWGMSGIGLDKAARIWVRALVNKFDSDTDYAAARTKCISAAGELFGAGSTEQKAVQNAFAAINVGSAASGYPGNPTLLSESEPNNNMFQPDDVTPATPPAGAPVNGALLKRTLVLGAATAADLADFYSVSVPSGKTLRITLVPSNDDDIELYDGFDTLIASSANGGSAMDQVKVTVANDGLPHPFTFKVKFFSMAGALVPLYQVFVDIL